MRSTLLIVSLLCACAPADEPTVIIDALAENPYAAGSEFSVIAEWSDPSCDRPRLAISIQDPSVVEILSTTEYSCVRTHVAVKAVADGDTQITVRPQNGGEVLAVAPIAVRRIAAIDIVDVIAPDRGEATAIGDEAQVVVQDGTIFETRAYDVAGTTLANVGAIAASSESQDVYAFPLQNILFVVPETEGSHDVVLEVDGEPLGSLRVVGVPADAVTDLRLAVPDEAAAEPLTQLCIGLIATDGIGRRVFGPSATWSIDGEVLDRNGERLCYQFAPEVTTSTVVAEVGDAQLTAQIRGEEFRTTGELGCAVARNPSSAIVAGLVLLMFGRLRRERKERQRR